MMDANCEDRERVGRVCGDVVRSAGYAGKAEIGLPAAAGCAQCPAAANVVISKSTRVHIGPKIISVTQNVSNNEVIKGRVWALWARARCRGGVLVCVCWAGVVACAVGALALHLLLPRRVRLDIGLREPWYLRRDDWQAMPPYNTVFLNIPIKTVIIGHSATKFCRDRYHCIREVLGIQQDHLRREYDDIGPNFLVGGGGLVLEGRGADVCGAMVKHWNSSIISIMLLGDYRHDHVDPVQIENVKYLLEILVKEGVLLSDYEIFGSCQIVPDTVSPGAFVMGILNQFPHWNPNNANACLN